MDRARKEIIIKATSYQICDPVGDPTLRGKTLQRRPICTSWSPIADRLTGAAPHRKLLFGRARNPGVYGPWCGNGSCHLLAARISLS